MQRIFIPPHVPAMLRVGDRIVRVESYSGAEPSAAVVNEPGGLLPYSKKHLGTLGWADLVANVGIDADPALFQWIGDAWFGQPVRDEVVLDAFDPVEKMAQTIQLQKPLLHEVILPGLDRASHDRRLLTVRISPESVLRRPGGSVIVEPLEAPRELRAHAFTIEIDGIDCSGVQAIAPITVQTRPASQTEGMLVFSDVHLAVAADKSGSFRGWFDDFVLRGNHGDDRELDGRITFYDPLLKDALATLELYHLGIYRMGQPKAGLAPVDLYCERMELKTFAAI